MTKWVGPMWKVGAVLVVGGATLVAAGTVRSQGQADTTPGAADTVTTFEAPVDVDTTGLPGPRQPILFRHDIHAGQYQMACRYCHAYVEQSANPGLPSVAACMGCHLIVGSGNAEVQKLRDAYAANKPIEWIQVHREPPFVHFPHMRHVVNGKLDCKECHGPVNRMPQVYKFSSLKMGWCVGCHVTKEYEKTSPDEPGRPVTADCSACHY
jgi:hypothetical protein